MGGCCGGGQQKATAAPNSIRHITVSRAVRRNRREARSLEARSRGLGRASGIGVGGNGHAQAHEASLLTDTHKAIDADAELVDSREQASSARTLLRGRVVRQICSHTLERGSHATQCVCARGLQLLEGTHKLPARWWPAFRRCDKGHELCRLLARSLQRRTHASCTLHLDSAQDDADGARVSEGARQQQYKGENGCQ